MFKQRGEIFIMEFEEYKNAIKESIFSYVDSLGCKDVKNIINSYFTPIDRERILKGKLPKICNAYSSLLMSLNIALYDDNRIPQIIAQSIASCYNRPVYIEDSEFSKSEIEDLLNFVHKIESTLSSDNIECLVKEGRYNEAIGYMIGYFKYGLLLSDFIEEYSIKNKWEKQVNALRSVASERL